MDTQKQEIITFVKDQRQKGQCVKKTVAVLGVARSSYYRWKGGPLEKNIPVTSTRTVTPEEIRRIDSAINQYPGLRHRQIQGILQNTGFYISPATVYSRFKELGLVEPYRRRPSPLKTPQYEVFRRNVLWGGDWTRLLIGGVRWYLLTLIDFFSRFIIAYRIAPSVNAGVVKALYREGLLSEKIPLSTLQKPELRLDCGSPNTSRITRDFFEAIGADLSFARVRRPTDNAITERFYGTIKQEEIYLVGNYPDEVSADLEIGSYIGYYNNKRPHQALWNFTPRRIHDVNNKTEIMRQLRELKQKTLEARRNYWLNQLKNDLQKTEILSH
jgi:transposase InsO family protein